MTNAPLPVDIVDLLQAVVDALDAPIANDAAGDTARLDLFAGRAGDVRVVLAHLLKSEHLNARESAETLRAWTAERPISYTAWKDTREGASTLAAWNGGAVTLKDTP